jgi:hypothetical protein
MWRPASLAWDLVGTWAKRRSGGKDFAAPTSPNPLQSVRISRDSEKRLPSGSLGVC